MGPEIYHIFIVCGIIAKEWRKEMSNASKNKDMEQMAKDLGLDGQKEVFSPVSSDRTINI